MALENIMESIVRDRLDKMIAEQNVCKCKQCYVDILAIALNKLPPKYVNTHKGELLVRILETTSQNLIDIDVEITKAIQIVSKNPRH